MSRTLQRRDPGLGWMALCSLAIHLALYFFLVAFHFPTRLAEAPVYYVDVVNLPVANPRAGTPTTAGAPSPPAPEPAPARQEMALPAKPAPKPATKPASPAAKPAESRETAQQFEERLAKLEQAVAARHEAAAIDALRKKLAGSGKGGQVGMPGAKGTEAGSDYANYIRSRLTDAFRTTIAYQSKKPEVVLRLTIDRTGRVVGQRIERSSNDRLFEDSVARAVAKAAKNFPPPPGGGGFDYSFRFVPEGVSKK